PFEGRQQRSSTPCRRTVLVIIAPYNYVCNIWLDNHAYRAGHMGKTQEGQLCTVAEAARVLDVHPSTIWRWIEAERLPAYRLGPKTIRIKRQDLEAILQPARGNEAVAKERDRPLFTPPTPEEIARRKALVAEILQL